MNYGYHFNLEKHDKKELEHILQFTTKTDFLFYKKNWNWIEKELRRVNYELNSSQEYETEEELVFKKDLNELFFYL